MVEDIYKLKNEILSQVKKEVELRGAERIDINRIGEMIDMVKDLAEAEEKCWEAQYYRNAVTSSMESKYGYTPYNGRRMGYNDGGGTGSSTPYRMGYSDIVEELKRAVMDSNADEKQRMKNEIYSIIGSI